jgi:hypothetical protein
MVEVHHSTNRQNETMDLVHFTFSTEISSQRNGAAPAMIHTDNSTTWAH